MVLRSWSLTMEFWRSLPTEILKTIRCAERLSYVSIEWLRIVSITPRVEEPNSEDKKLINVRTWTTESPHVFVSVHHPSYAILVDRFASINWRAWSLVHRRGSCSSSEISGTIGLLYCVQLLLHLSHHKRLLPLRRYDPVRNRRA